MHEVQAVRERAEQDDRAQREGLRRQRRAQPARRDEERGHCETDDQIGVPVRAVGRSFTVRDDRHDRRDRGGDADPAPGHDVRGARAELRRDDAHPEQTQQPGHGAVEETVQQEMRREPDRDRQRELGIGAGAAPHRHQQQREHHVDLTLERDAPHRPVQVFRRRRQVVHEREVCEYREHHVPGGDVMAPQRFRDVDQHDRAGQRRHVSRHQPARPAHGERARRETPLRMGGDRQSQTVAGDHDERHDREVAVLQKAGRAAQREQDRARLRHRGLPEMVQEHVQRRYSAQPFDVREVRAGRRGHAHYAARWKRTSKAVFMQTVTSMNSDQFST